MIRTIPVRIEAVISTAGNNEFYLGQHLGNQVIERPLTRMVVTFETELTPQELELLQDSVDKQAKIVKEFRNGSNAIQMHSFRYMMFCSETSSWQ